MGVKIWAPNKTDINVLWINIKWLLSKMIVYTYNGFQRERHVHEYSYRVIKMGSGGGQNYI